MFRLSLTTLALAALLAACQPSQSVDLMSAAATGPVEGELGDVLDGFAWQRGRLIVTQPLDDPALAQRALQRGEMMLQQNRFGEAVRAFAAAVRADAASAAAFRRLGWALHAERHPREAEACYRSAVFLAPEDPLAHDALARQLAQRQAFVEAIEQMRRVLALSDDVELLGAAHERIAIWSYYLGDDASAWGHVRDAEQLAHPMPPHFTALLARRTPRPD